nr:urotensin-2B isoform X2 [Macaca nemestrina]XP_011721412.1 urotensin-2B isoform X2 [Macaca nemestrina]XP_011721413.1 urotensin-2B isoform X2 [Macaca nemestrina]XP_011721414.1 urotensin-2B isoform X2 [Macaca nemestrina]XP_011721415.1 urotensin-2B isoform X2 [Macaca nemestrina]XP_011721416.1 urotensin-2B isoform X2 [Macaca nemestrina]XP_011721417.1 urotensin-2B isoform X2 [Macaca nemestrina]
MNKILSSTLCFGLLTLSSVLIFLQSVRGRPYYTQELSLGERKRRFSSYKTIRNEILPDKNYPNREELLLALLNKNFDFQRSFNTDLALPNKLEELNQFYQLEKLKEQLVEKDSDMSYAIDGLFSSHPSKRALSSRMLIQLNCLQHCKTEEDKGYIPAFNCLSSEGAHIISTEVHWPGLVTDYHQHKARKICRMSVIFSKLSKGQRLKSALGTFRLVQ